MESALITESKLFGDIVLPRPVVGSASYPEQCGNLVDVLDEIIESMLAKLAMSTGKSPLEIEADLDVLETKDIMEEKGKELGKSGNRSRRRGRGRGKKR